MSLNISGHIRGGLLAGAVMAAAGLGTAMPASALSPEGRDALGTAVGVGAGILLLDSIVNAPSRRVVVEPRYSYGYPPPPPPPVYVVPARPWGPPGPPRRDWDDHGDWDRHGGWDHDRGWGHGRRW